MTTEERLAKVERELGRVKRRSRWLLAALGLGLGVLALVWASAASTPRAEAQGAVGGAAPVGPCRYQLAVAPGYYKGGTSTGGSMWSETQLYLLDQSTGVLFTRGEIKDSKTGIIVSCWVTRSPTARLVVDDPTQPHICPDCKGTGRLISPQGAKKCPTCNGTGKVAP